MRQHTKGMRFVRPAAYLQSFFKPSPTPEDELKQFVESTIDRSVAMVIPLGHLPAQAQLEKLLYDGMKAQSNNIIKVTIGNKDSYFQLVTTVDSRTQPLNTMTVKELKALATKMNIPGRSQLKTKEDFVKTIGSLNNS